MSLAMEFGPNRSNRPIGRRLPRWLIATATALIVIGLASVGLAVLMSHRPVAIEQPERQMAILLKECKISISLKPANTTGQIVAGRNGAEWYACNLTPFECESLIEALRARVDGKSARVTTDNAQTGAALAPAWWTPHTSHQLFAFEIDPPTFWIGVAQDQNKMFLRRSR